MKLKDQLLRVAETYCAAVGRSEARISTRIWGAGGRFRALRAGSDMLSANIEAGLSWFSDHWPEGVAWPDQVPRPVPSPPPAEDPDSPGGAEP